MRQSDRQFGIKDVFTSINVLGGVVAICLCIENRPFEAGLAVLLGYIFGDAIDGWVARKLGTQNEFGAEYDKVADHGSHVIAPAAIVFTVYRQPEIPALLGLPAKVTWVLAAALASGIILASTIRHARNEVRPVRYDGVWAGLPRSVLGFLAVGCANSALMPLVPGGYWIGVVMIPILCVATLTHYPFPNHRMPRRHFWYVRALIGLFFLTTLIVLAFAPHFFFDIVFFWMFGYSATGWMSLTVEERKKYREAVELATSGKSA
jgi:phosphatidylserine synthase